MNHDEAKKILLSNPEIKKEYDALEPIYEIRKQLIELRLRQGLCQKDLGGKIGTNRKVKEYIKHKVYISYGAIC